MSFKSLILLIGLVLCTVCESFLVHNLKEGSKCYHNQTQSIGVCTSTKIDCEFARENFKNNDIYPQICGYSGPGGKDLIICCPNVSVTPVPTTVTPVPEPEDRFSTASKSQKWCSIYTKYTNTVSPPTNKSMCGLIGQNLIYNGVEAKGKEFPHMAMVGYGTAPDIAWNCAGSLISNQWVLTAAHCVYSDYGDAKYVRLGELNYNTNDDDATPQDFEIIQRHAHPNHRDYQYDDIGLLKMNRIVEFSAYIRPACLWPTKHVKNGRVIITGWGTKGVYEEKSPALLKAIINMKSYGECVDTFPAEARIPRGIDDELQFCAGAAEDDEKRDSCPGDSGGPLQMPADPEYICMYYVVGVTSFGRPCGIIRRPGVYTRVSHYVSWIESLVWP